MGRRPTIDAMSAHNTPTDVGAVLRQRWALGVVAVVTAVIAAAVTQLVVGDAAGLAVPVIVAALIGLLLGAVAIVVAEAVDGTIRAPHQLVKLTSAPNLGVVPRHQVDVGRPEGVTMFSEPDSVEAEGYRSAFTALEFVLRSSAVAVPGAVGSPVAGRDADAAAPRLAAPGKIVLVTSARPGEGKSSVAANLAAAAALAGRRVVLVDADLRKPQVHRLLRLENDAGLSTMLTGEAKGFSAVQRLESLRHLVVLSGGPPPPDPAELLASPRLGAALTSMAAQADLLIVDSPPVLAVTDPTLIAQQCDATIMVATAGASDRREWAEALSRLGVVDADVVGTVLIQPDERHSGDRHLSVRPQCGAEELAGGRCGGWRHRRSVAGRCRAGRFRRCSSVG